MDTSQSAPLRVDGNPLAADLDFILRETPELWAGFRGRRFFLTGGTGFVGCWLLESLLWANERIGLNATATVLTRDPAGFSARAPHLAGNAAIATHVGDVRDFRFPEAQFDYVIHGATTNAAATFNNEDALAKFDTVALGARRTVQFAEQCGAAKMLLLSSGAMYGKQPPELTHMPESYVGGPDPMATVDAALGEGKRAAEFLAVYHARRYGIDLKVARLFSFVGPYLPLDIHYAVGNFIRDGMAGGPIVVRGDGSPIRSYLYAADLVVWLWTILARGDRCHPYNVGSEVSMTIRELAEIVAGRCGRAIEVRVAGRRVEAGAANRYVPSTKRAQEALGLRQVITLESALDRTIEYVRTTSRVGPRT